MIISYASRVPRPAASFETQLYDLVAALDLGGAGGWPIPLRTLAAFCLIPVAAESTHLVCRTERSAPRTLIDAGSRGVCRGDTNPANYLWTDCGLKLLDFEDAGWSDPVFELADRGITMRPPVTPLAQARRLRRLLDS